MMKKISSYALPVLIVVGLFAAQAGALEIGAGLWLPEGTFKSAVDVKYDSELSGKLNVLTVPGSPIGIGPVALVSETNLGTNLNFGELKTLIQDKTGNGFLFADLLGGIRMNLPIKLFGISAQGLVSYGATGFANVNLENENSKYFTSLYWGPRFRGQLKKEIVGNLLTAVASYEFAPELHGLRKRATVEGEAPDEQIENTSLTNYRLGLEAHVPFATIGAGYRSLTLEDGAGYKADFSGYYAEAKFGF
mgnify:CR=1 FL=1|jgi:hypothetical protein